MTGWALFLDYLIVIALSALFLPHYVAAALGVEALRDSPWDVVVTVAAIAVIGAVRLVRRARLHTAALVVALLDLAVQLLIVVLGLALVFSPETLADGFARARARTGSTTCSSRCRSAMLAYTGLETVANLAEEAREPGRTLPRSLFSAIGLVVVLTVLVAMVGVTAFPARTARPRSATSGSRRRSSASWRRSRASCPPPSSTCSASPSGSPARSSC